MGKYEAVEAVHGAVDTETFADLKRLAAHMKCSVDHLVATAVIRFVNEEIGAITPDEFPDLPPYISTDPTTRALDEAERAARIAMRAFLQVGVDDLDAGRTYSHEEVMQEMRERAAGRQAAE